MTIAHGLGGLLELGVEADPAQRHTGSEVVRDALTLVPDGEVVVAACAPATRGRSGLSGAGFDPVGSVQLWRTGPMSRLPVVAVGLVGSLGSQRRPVPWSP